MWKYDDANGKISRHRKWLRLQICIEESTMVLGRGLCSLSGVFSVQPFFIAYS